MASSSSAPAPKPRPHEVFLSFRGEDTRYNFVSHLRSALKHRGVITYYDETNLQNGQTIADELSKAIQESASAIVVLSKNYGSSTWCLNELVKIVECKNTNNLTIYPIFYGVDPSDVRHQRNSFFDAFSKHEDKYKDQIGMVNAWRKALREVSDITGEDIRDKDEASCLEKIANEILRNLPPDSHFKESLVGIGPHISRLKGLIYSNSDEVRFIGIWGMGGVGKTTTARAIFYECESDFEGSCLLLDVRRRKNEMEKLQQQLISQVLKRKIEDIDDVVKGSSMIRKRMCSKRVLLVLDDVDDRDQLDCLAGECNWFGKGSRIIITTRDDHLLNLKGVNDKYKVKPLDDKEALLLFCKHAFKNEHPEENYKELSHKVLSYAGGLPLALEVLGDHLYGQEESFWSDALTRLGKDPERKIIDILQISFDSLNSHQQNIFLYIACLFRGEMCSEVMEYLSSLELYPKEGIKVLIDKSLISEPHIKHDSRLGIYDDSEGRTTFEMHDLLQDMGQHIVRKRANREVQNYSHLWLEEDIKRVLLNYKGSPETEGMIIKDAMESKLLKKESFMNMNKLRFLRIKYPVPDNYFVQFPRGLQCLHLFYYHRDRLGTHPSISMNLVYLKVQYSHIEKTPNFDLMPKLEVLELSTCFELVHIHESLGRHTKIKRIKLRGCGRVEEFPPIVDMRSLETLDLCRTHLLCFPEITGNVDKLADLNLDYTCITTLPESIGRATGLRELNLTCGYLDSLPFSLQPLGNKVIVDWNELDDIKREVDEEKARRTSVTEILDNLSTTEIMKLPVEAIFRYFFPRFRKSDPGLATLAKFRARHRAELMNIAEILKVVDNHWST